MGLLVLGLNPRRPYDGDYQQFISLLRQKLGTTLASSILFEEEVRRGRNAIEQAAFDRAWLSEQLALRTKEVDESTRRFQTVAEVVPVGLAFATSDGHVTYANDTWYNITGVEKDSSSPKGLLQCVLEDDYPTVSGAWARLFDQR
jgi:PAS domain-containing protein